MRVTDHSTITPVVRVTDHSIITPVVRVTHHSALTPVVRVTDHSTPTPVVRVTDHSTITLVVRVTDHSTPTPVVRVTDHSIITPVVRVTHHSPLPTLSTFLCGNHAKTRVKTPALEEDEAHAEVQAKGGHHAGGGWGGWGVGGGGGQLSPTVSEGAWKGHYSHMHHETGRLHHHANVLGTNKGQYKSDGMPRCTTHTHTAKQTNEGER